MTTIYRNAIARTTLEIMPVFRFNDITARLALNAILDYSPTIHNCQPS
jgi:hypothetical protein